MITPQQAAQLRSLIEQYRNSAIADSWKGGGDPADTPYIEREWELARRELELFITTLATPAPTGGKP